MGAEKILFYLRWWQFNVKLCVNGEDDENGVGVPNKLNWY